MPDPVISLKNLKKYFGSTKAVDDISFTVQKGEIFGFLGPNGAGKTTTIRCLMDFIRPDSGKITINNLDAHLNSPEVKAKVGYLSPDVHLYDHWTGADHLKFIEKLKGKSPNTQQLLKKLELNPNIKTKTLSSGNRQKLGLILALMADPEILVLDEPTAALDPLLQNRTYEILKEYQNKGCTIFLSSHNLPEVERICSRVAIIRQGKLIAVEDIIKLKEKHLRVIQAQFSKPINREDFTMPGVEITQHNQDRLTLKVAGDLNPVIKKLASCHLSDLEINHANLEDIFMGFYK